MTPVRVRGYRQNTAVSNNRRHPYWAATAQQTAFELIARKVSAAHQVSGLDIRSALEAAGAAEDSGDALETALAVGEALYRQLAPAA